MVDNSSRVTRVTSYVDDIYIDYCRQGLQLKITPYTESLINGAREILKITTHNRTSLAPCLLHNHAIVIRDLFIFLVALSFYRSGNYLFLKFSDLMLNSCTFFLYACQLDPDQATIPDICQVNFF